MAFRVRTSAQGGAFTSGERKDTVIRPGSSSISVKDHDAGSLESDPLLLAKLEF